MTCSFFTISLNILPCPVCGEVCEIDHILLESSRIKVDFLHILNTANMFKFFFINLWLVFRKIHPFHWRRKWQPTSVFLPGEVHGQRSLASYSAWRHKESDMTQQHFSLFSSISCSNNLVSEEVVKVEKIKSKAGLCLVAQPLITRHLNHFCH